MVGFWFLLGVSFSDKVFRETLNIEVELRELSKEEKKSVMLKKHTINCRRKNIFC